MGGYYLLDEFCQRCDVAELRTAFWHFTRKLRPSLALIERSADGPALHALVSRKARFEIRLISALGSKGERFERHRKKILSGGVCDLPEDAVWRASFISEIAQIFQPILMIGLMP